MKGADRSSYALVAMIIAVAAALAYFSFMPQMQEPASVFDQQVSGAPFAFTDGTGRVFIDTNKAAGGHAERDYYGLIRYKESNYWLLFVPEGIYNGEVFYSSHEDDDGNVIIAFNDTMDPDNGIIEGWMTFRVIDNELHARVFLDEDWRSRIQGTTRLFWGEHWNLTRAYGWKEIYEGVYMDTVTMSAKYLYEDITAPIHIFVGNATPENVGIPERMRNMVGFSFS